MNSIHSLLSIRVFFTSPVDVERFKSKNIKAPSDNKDLYIFFVSTSWIHNDAVLKHISVLVHTSRSTCPLSVSTRSWSWPTVCISIGIHIEIDALVGLFRCERRSCCQLNVRVLKNAGWRFSFALIWSWFEWIVTIDNGVGQCRCWCRSSWWRRWSSCCSWIVISTETTWTTKLTEARSKLRVPNRFIFNSFKTKQPIAKNFFA